MTTSGTAAFSMDLTELVEEAFERAGGELRTGYDLRTASRSLNLMFSQWANKGLNMFTYEEGSIALVPGQSTYRPDHHTHQCFHLRHHSKQADAGKANPCLD